MEIIKYPKFMSGILENKWWREITEVSRNPAVWNIILYSLLLLLLVFSFLIFLPSSLFFSTKREPIKLSNWLWNKKICIISVFKRMLVHWVYFKGITSDLLMTWRIVTLYLSENMILCFTSLYWKFEQNAVWFERSPQTSTYRKLGV